MALLVSLITLWRNGTRISSLVWQQNYHHQQQLSSEVNTKEDSTNGYHHFPPNVDRRRTGVYPRSVQYSYRTNTNTDWNDGTTKTTTTTTTTGRQLQLDDDHQLPPWKVMELYKQQHQYLLDDEKGNNATTYSRDAAALDGMSYATTETDDDECQVQYDWQRTTYPTCNNLHELDMTRLLSSSSSFETTMSQGRATTTQSPSPQVPLTTGDSSSRLKYMANGYWRDVWTVQELNVDNNNNNNYYQKYYNNNNNVVVLKTMRYEHDFVARNYDRHRRDALVAGHLTKSKFVVDIYGYCGNSAVFEYGTGGDIVSAIWPSRTLLINNNNIHNNLTQMEKLLIGTYVGSDTLTMN